MTSTWIPPGDPKALALGCRCPHDQPRSFMGLWTYVMGCPVHDEDIAMALAGAYRTPQQDSGEVAGSLDGTP